MNTSSVAILWFRQDLRLDDNPALIEAANQGAVLPIYILDDETPGDWRLGGASRVWLHHALTALNKSLSGKLVIRHGNPLDILENLITQTKAQHLYWNRLYESFSIARDKKIKETLSARGITIKSFNASLLYEPWEVLKDDGTPYKVFTPFFRKGCVKAGGPPLPKPAPVLQLATFKDQGSINDLGLLPSIQWHRQIEHDWQPGEIGAKAKLKRFIEHGLSGYKEDRNRPDLEKVSRLSPYLHFGEISPRTVWHAVRQAMVAQGFEKDGDHFLSELGWREFSYHLLFHFPALPIKPLQSRFELFPWNDNPRALTQWQKGQTGYPIIDAGMRQLWQTGWMHNRVRMIVGSFLVKNLRLHWHHGEKWFWDTLVDADLANNAASWQWIAGCGADAAPYFRIFNPVLQGEKFDPDGSYVRHYVPELKNMSSDFIHKPWDAPPLILKQSGVLLGVDYPHPIVDHATARDAALAAFQMTKGVE